MKNILITLALTLGLLLTVGAQQSRTTWEYKFAYQCDEKKTNNLAAEGWELSDMSMVSIGGSMGAATCVFKRPK